MRHAGRVGRRRVDSHARWALERRRTGPATARIHRSAGRSVRLLHEWNDHDREGFAREKQGADRGRDQASPLRPFVPVRFAQPHRARGSASGKGTMTSRRDFLKGSGVIVATFALGVPHGRAQVNAGRPPVSFAKNRKLDGWIAVDSDGAVTVFTGKVELGQGILTALAQIAAEEIDVDLDQIGMVSGNTVRGPDEGYTFGSQSVEQSGSALRAASAFARATLVAAAAKRLNVDPTAVTVENGVVTAPDGRRLAYGEIVRDDRKLLDRDVSHLTAAKPPQAYRIVGKSVPRIDLPDKVMARGIYLQDMRMPGMVFGRVVRPPSAGAELQSIDEAVAGSLPGVLAVVRLSSFLGGLRV